MIESYANVLEQIATISEDRQGNPKKLCRVRWRNGSPKLDVRTWILDGSPAGRPGHGVTLDLEEAAVLRDALAQYLKIHGK